MTVIERRRSALIQPIASYARSAFFRPLGRLHHRLIRNSALAEFARQMRTDPGKPIVVCWPTKEPVVRNWGDKLNPALVRLLSGREPINREDAPKGSAAHWVIGSGLTWARSKDTVWGNGVIIQCEPDRIRQPRICAVRGPLSRSLLLAAGRDCPEVYGDPALLMPLFYNPEVTPSYDVGLIQHCREIGEEPLPLLPPGLTVRVIDITGGIEEVIDAILSCRRILSSSLHGIIAAHAYGVPATWLKLSERPLGDGIKFKDYWASMGRDHVEPIQVKPGVAIDPEAGVSTPGKPLVDLFRLIQACPFINGKRKAELLRSARALADTSRPNSIFRIHAGLTAMDSSRLRGDRGWV